MITTITDGVKVSVETIYQPEYSNPANDHYMFAYKISIENVGHSSVQLLRRHWEIFDSLNNIEIVDGEGIIGKKPVLKPGENHTYSSGCLLSSPYGAMKGHFNMINFTNTKTFKVIIPTFRLCAPFALN